MREKFLFHCRACGAGGISISCWFEAGQKCPHCHQVDVNAVYRDAGALPKLISDGGERLGLWRYFDLLPVNKPANIVSGGEGNVAVERWAFVESFVESCWGRRVRVYAHRNDNNYATGTFKDLAGSLVASALKEQGITSYVVASTGNIGVAFARYLSNARVALYAFIPQRSPLMQLSKIACFGQRVFHVQGDYAMAKVFAEQFAALQNLPLAAGTFDPLRVEAKKTMAYEWARQMPEFPSVYVQALSGGTGPVGVAQGCQDLLGIGAITRMPRFLLVQSDKCAPMAQAWREAERQCFPDYWERRYPVIRDPETSISTLATGDPTAYPRLAPLVRKSGGAIIDFEEDKAVHVARYVAFFSGVRMGPAAAVGVGGFFKAVAMGLVNDGDVVALNIGEGIRRAPEFMEQLALEVQSVAGMEDCAEFNRDSYGETVAGTLARAFDA